MNLKQVSSTSKINPLGRVCDPPPKESNSDDNNSLFGSLGRSTKSIPIASELSWSRTSLRCSGPKIRRSLQRLICLYFLRQNQCFNSFPQPQPSSVLVVSLDPSTALFRLYFSGIIGSSAGFSETSKVFQVVGDNPILPFSFGHKEGHRSSLFEMISVLLSWWWLKRPILSNLYLNAKISLIKTNVVNVLLWQCCYTIILLLLLPLLLLKQLLWLLISLLLNLSLLRLSDLKYKNDTTNFF